jgi:nucleoside-diphosphate-sugar epimerase
MTRPILVTGATGLVGHGIACALVRGGHPVRALVRNIERARRLLPPDVELVQGDITEPATLAPALDGSRLVFHAAGMPEQWQRDPMAFDRVNRAGTSNVLSAALQARAERVVYTSTMDVFAAAPGGTLTESNVDSRIKPTPYERSKQAAEREAVAIERAGLDIVYINPGAVYGVSPIVTTLNKVLLRLLRGKVPMLPPGGLPLAFLDGVVQAHLAAAERGRRSERYLVADEHVTMRQLATLALREAGGHRRIPPTAPAWLLRWIAAVSAFFARALDTEPLIAPGELTFLLWNVSVDSSKAQRELGFTPTAASVGIRKTIQSLLAILASQ